MNFNNFPLTLRVQKIESSAAALSMILQYYGKSIPLDILAIDCSITGEYNSADKLILAARQHRLDGFGVTMAVSEVMASKIPLILHWNKNNFVVFKGYKSGKFYINDPELGSVSVLEDEFCKCFTGTAIVLEPTEEFSGSVNRVSSNILMHAFKKEHILLILIAGSILGFLVVAISSIYRLFVDFALNSSGFDDQFNMISLFVIILILSFFVLEGIKNRVFISINSSISKRIKSVDIAFISTLNPWFEYMTETYISTLNVYIKDAIYIISHKIIPFLVLLVSSYIYIATIMISNFYVGCVVLFYFSVGIIMSVVIRNEIKSDIALFVRDGARLAINNGVNASITYSNSGFRVKHKIELQKSRFLALSMFMLLSTAFIIACLLFVGRFTIGASISIIAMTAIIGYVLCKMPDVLHNFIMAAELMNSSEFARKIHIPNVFDDRINFNNSIIIKNLSYRQGIYSDDILERVNLNILKGSVINILNITESEKRALYNSLTRDIKNIRGDIYLDSKSIKEFNTYEICNGVKYIGHMLSLEDSAKSVSDIINMGADINNTRLVLEISKLIGLHDIISKRDIKYDVIAGDVSNTEATLINIIKAVNENAFLIIFDDKFSYIGVNIQQKVLDFLRLKNITGIMFNNYSGGLDNCKKYVLENKTTRAVL